MKQGPSIKNIFKLIVVISYDTTILNKLYLIIKNPQVPKKVMYRIIIKKYFIFLKINSCSGRGVLPAHYTISIRLTLVNGMVCRRGVD